MKRYIFILALFQALFCFGQNTSSSWPIFRGNADLSGKTDAEIPASPRLLWSYNTGTRTYSTPVVSEGLIYFGSEKGTIYACDVNGRMKWRTNAGTSVDAPPMVSGDKVIFSTSEGTLMAANKKSGKILWSYKTDAQIAGSANLWSSGSKSGIVVGSYDYYLHCVNSETGKPLWKIETENYINGTPAYSNGNIVFGGCDGIIRMVDPVTGKEKETIPIGIYIASSPALEGSKVFFGDYDGNFYCLDITTRKIVWQKISDGQIGPIFAVPAVGYGLVVIGSDDKYVYCYNSSDGTLKWKFRTNGSIRGSAVISKDRILITSMDGNIYLLDPATGSKLWSFNTGSSVSSSPAVIKDRFFILSEDGRLMAFGLK